MLGFVYQRLQKQNIMSNLIKVVNEPERQLRLIQDPTINSFLQVQIETDFDDAFIDLDKSEVDNLIFELQKWRDSK